MKPTLAWIAGLVLGSAAPLAAGEPVDYVRDVKPILAQHCVACHGAVKPRAGLRLDTAAAALKGNAEGPAVVPGKSDESSLVAAVLGEGAGERMPLKRPPLPPAQVEVLRGWIDQGASFPADETPSAGPPPHWAFQPPARPAPPSVSGSTWCRNPIDGFILARLGRESIAPSPEADPITLMRRASLDLVGLPPTPEEVEAFLADGRPDRFERLVDRLLASPHYGERWARPWLDLARYADSNGYSIDAPRSIWKYRDWLIDALNGDMPFDAFVIDQLAGDLRPSASLAQLVATGFHRNTPINQEGGIDLEQFRVESIVDRVATTGTVFLGLTIGCAQCHDHKYDPLAQREFYQLFAFFNSVDEPEIEFATPEEKAKRDQIRARIDRFHRDLGEQHPEIDGKETAWEAGLSPVFKQALTAELKDAFDKPRDKRSERQRRGLVELFLADAPEYRPLHDTLAGLRKEEPRFVTSMVVRERKQPRDTFVLVGGDFTRKGERVGPGVPAVLPPLKASSHPTRMDLARWLVDPANPLTARVTVNRLWQAYFGNGIVETENDFGTQGTPPSHPELLDWLATEFIARGWSLKAMHRLIVTSAAYRQSSHARPDLDTIDPSNRLLARQSRLRLDAELIRDQALAASGLLTDRLGGPSVFPPLPPGVMTLGQVNRPWKADRGPDRFRRGLYTFFWRATPHPSLVVFDAPNAVQACTRRLRSNTPLQALTLLNDEAFHEFAQGLAERLLRAPASDDRGRIRWVYRLCLSREPSDAESATLLALLAQERSSAGGAENSSSGGGERLAWTSVARVLLNLDEFMTRE